MCKVLENRSQQDEERMDQLTNQLKEARMLAEDADGKSDEVNTTLLTLTSVNHQAITAWFPIYINNFRNISMYRLE